MHKPAKGCQSRRALRGKLTHPVNALPLIPVPRCSSLCLGNCQAVHGTRSSLRSSRQSKLSPAPPSITFSNAAARQPLPCMATFI